MLPPSQSLFSLNSIGKTLEEKGGLIVPVTEICFVNLISCILSSNDSMFKKKAKHCVVNTIAYPRLYRFELLED
jgi:hypothetical protein